MSRCNVNPIPLVMRVLILLDASHIQGTVSHISSVTFESSCVALNWSAAETDCSKKNATIFTLLDLAAPIGGKVLLNATAEHTRIWIEINGTTCKTSVNDSFLPANCSDTNYYVCKGNTSTSPDWYVPCREGSTDTSTQGSSGSTALNLATTTQGSNSKVTVIASATCVIVALVAVFILSGICIIKRNKKPIKYAVRAESAMYHKQHPDPAQVEEPKLADVQMVVSSTEAGIGNGGIDGRPDGEYDILCGVMGSEGKAATSDTTTVYSHLRGNIAADDSKEENHYDTATLPQYDRRPVDKIYDRLHVPDQ
ncbi:uncharacterized protein LOC124257045 isoform X2 [Haliotis rubra]|uniref:uncharacterized protein LOC124257045 isoform X2 n=1 Tax=Haliotis rubra TaxID=36100 RepID=UPI001EE54CCF|nr:uncharacterized protein LOC124257045 isoform X2 [Haliotis rubra]